MNPNCLFFFLRFKGFYGFIDGCGLSILDFFVGAWDRRKSLLGLAGDFMIRLMRMRLVMRSSSDEPVSLSLGYNHLVQAAIYNSISRELADFLHDRGFLLGRRAFKLFTFSRLLGRYRVGKGVISYLGDITLYISSPIERFVRELANSMVKKGFLSLGRNKLKIVELGFPKQPNVRNEVRIRMLSPVTVYSTLYTAENKKKTYYYSPYEREFSKLISENAKKKFFLIYKRAIKTGLTVKPLKVRENIVMYKNTVVKGWMGTFVLKGPKKLIQTVWDAGMGSKNPQGFGMFEVIE